MDPEVERAFDVAITESIRIGHKPWRFMQMREELGLRETARRLLLAGEVQSGLRRCYEDNRLDLSLESLVIRFGTHFGRNLVEAAIFHLERLASEELVR